MSVPMIDLLLGVGVQHLWQSALVLLLATAAFRLRPLAASARSWLWLAVFALAVLSPLAVFLPGQSAAAIVAPATPAVALPIEPVQIEASDTTGRSLAEAAMSVLKPAAALIWLLGCAWNLSRLLLGWREARRLRRDAAPAPELERRLAHELPTGTAVKLSDRITGPMVVGLARPCVLVPRALIGMVPDTVLLDLLRHEAAHVRRHDTRILFAQRCLLAFYWWNPVLRLITARLELAREMACDEHAAQRAATGRAYADSLLTGAGALLASRSRQRLLASGVFDGRRGLALRVERLLNMDPDTRRRDQRPALLLCGSALAASLALTLAATPRIGHAALAAADAEVSGQAVQLVEAAAAGRLDEVRRLVGSGVPVDARVPGEGTALIEAARAGHLPMVDALLRMGAPVDQASPGDGNPLIAAAAAGHHEVVDRLIAAGANVNAVVRHDETPLIGAVRSGHLPIVRCLVEKGADVNLGVRADLGVRTPLNQARDPAVHAYLISRGAVAAP